MVEVKKNKLSKTHLAIIITSAVLVFLIAGYVILSAVISSLAGTNNGQTQQKEPIALKDGEAMHGTTPVAYAPIQTSAIISVGVKGEKSSFAIGRPKEEATGLYENYFLFSYLDEDGNEKIYYPDILFAESGADYNDFYASDNSMGISISKVTMVLASIGAMYFADRLEPEADFDAQLARYGLDKEHREHIYVKYFTPDGEKEIDIYVGNKLISGKGYYYMIDGRNYIYVSSSTQFDNLLCDVESFLHSRVIAEGLPGDGLYGPFLTQDYKQWTNTYYGQNSTKPVSEKSEVIVFADIVEPVYNSTSTEGTTGYKSAGYSSFSINLQNLSKSDEAKRLINALVNKQIAKYEGSDEIVASYVFNSNEAVFGKTYHYTITKIEAVVTDSCDIEAVGTPVSEGDLVRVTYECRIDDSATNTSTEPQHAIIDLNNTNVPESVRATLADSRVGDDVSIKWDESYNEQNGTPRNVSMFITEIIYVQKKNADGSFSYASEITAECIVKFAYKYVIDGKDTADEGEMLVDLSKIIAGDDLAIKEALVGLRPGELPDEAVYSETRYTQYMQDFLTYRIREIKGFVEREMVVSFEFLNATAGDGRDPFYAESIYKNTLTNEYRSYPLDAFACQTVTFLLGGVGGQSSNMATGLEGKKTVAVGLTPANMEKFGLYEGYTIYFELPRGIGVMDGSDKDELDNYTWASTLGFTLYISKAQSDGTRYIASDLYDIIVEIDGAQFNFLEKSFGEYWARKNLIMVDYLNIDEIKVDINMDDIFGSYEFDLIHDKKYVLNGNIVAPGTEGATTVNLLKVRTRPLGEDMSYSVFSKFIKDNPVVTGVDIADIYNMVAGEELMVRNDTAGAASFKNILQMLFAVNYTGSLDKDEAAEVIGSCQKILSMQFSLIGGHYHYVYDFYRATDRKVMVQIYRVDDNGNVVNSSKDESSGFYISTFAAKKIVNSFNDLLNGVMVNPDVSYWN